ncbi:MAG TPA: hypothetical protein VFX49_00080, partial [Chloroflexota bacterium]|nr:hypothetical protein [Chloroflexota bacterium]
MIATLPGQVESAGPAVDADGAQAGANRFLRLLRTRTLLADGAMGTLLEALGAAAREAGRPGPDVRVPEELNTLSPERVLAVHRAYV